MADEREDEVLGLAFGNQRYDVAKIEEEDVVGD